MSSLLWFNQELQKRFMVVEGPNQKKTNISKLAFV